jgi:pimeloyl-ACP methyl ester carboxylesterase
MPREQRENSVSVSSCFSLGNPLHNAIFAADGISSHQQSARLREARPSLADSGPVTDSTSQGAVCWKQRNFQMIKTNGLTLRTVVEGKGPSVILLHGWPQCWYLWRHQIDPLVAAGFQVAVPYQRGYGGSDQPAAVEAYNILELTADVAGITTALGHMRFIVVGHDWGAPVAWHTALLYPERVQAVAGLSVPYARWKAGEMTRQENFGDNFWYSVYFQKPRVAEGELDADIRKSL